MISANATQAQTVRHLRKHQPGGRVRDILRSFYGSVTFLLLLPAAVISLFAAAAAANGISDRLSLWFFDAAFAVFPVGCHYTRTDCSADGWLHHYWSFLAWLMIAIAFGWLTRDAPLKTRLGAAVLLVMAVVLFMQVLMVLLGWNSFVPTL